MGKSHVSLVIGLTATAAVWTPLPAEAATFDYSRVENIDARPIDSDHVLNFFGDPSENEGFTAFFNLDFTAPDVGHIEISKNAPGNIAPYYTTGRQASPEEPDSGSTRSASLNHVTGFSNFFSYLSDNSISLSTIGLGYGQKSDRDFRATWNLGEDKQGQDWFASPDSNLEERIYRANPDDVEIFISYEDTKILNFGYTDFYNILDYGDSVDNTDDFDIILTDPFTAEIVEGLDPFSAGLAQAFLVDIAEAGGGVQVVFEEAGVEDAPLMFGNGFGVLSFPFPFTLRGVAIATVPEPSSVIGIFMLGALGALARSTKHKKGKSLH